jgi:uncharacterized membrane protein YjgN (DUF898 family)
MSDFQLESDLQFEIVLKGVLPGFDSEQAKADFAALFSLEAEKVERLFAAERTVLKTNISREIAEKYTARLAAIGVHASIEGLQIQEANSEETLALDPVYEEDESATLEIDASADQQTCASAQSAEVPAQNQRELHRHAFVFSGNGPEYFKIWIVNILLSIVTLGVYSAWAKVRNKQYFYGNTQLADNTFEYTADPIKILKGRVIAVILYGALFFAHHISPMASVVATIVFLLFLPLIIVNSLKFNARYSSYRNIPFHFGGTIWGAVKAFILWPMAGIFSFGLLFPLAWKRQSQYITNNHSYGKEPFRFDVHVKEYFFMLLILTGVSVGFVLLIVFLVVCVVAILNVAGISMDSNSVFVMIPVVIGYMAFYLALGAYVIVTMANIHWNNTRLHRHLFTANWTIPSYASLLITNTLGILFTLGLFIPFAKVRTANYKANHMAFIAEGNLDHFVASELQQSNSLGEGVHDIFDIDISI